MYVNLSDHQVNEILNCADDPWHLLQNYVWLEREAEMDTSVVPFHPYPKQQAILEALVARKNILANKSRRVGWSWICAFFAWWLINFHKGVKVLFLSRTEDDAKSILEKVKFLHVNLAWRGDGDNFDMAEKADWLAGEIVVDNTTTFSRGWRNDKGKIVNHSAVISLTNTDNSGRGKGATFILLDEFAFYQNAEKTWRAMSKTIIGGGFWAVGSTPNGIGNKFHWLVASAEVGNNISEAGEELYRYLTFHWSESWIDPDDVTRDKSTADSDADANQEWELTFLADGNTVFDSTDLAACYVDIEDPFFPDKARQKHIIYKIREYRAKVEAGRAKYLSGADTAVGKIQRKSSEKDYHAFVALTEDGIQVKGYTSQKPISFWAGYVEANSMGDKHWTGGKLASLHEDHPGLLLIEEDGAGAATLLNHITPNDGISETYPFTAAGRGKHDAVVWLNTLIQKHQIVITHKGTYQQLMIYQDNGPGAGRYSAPPGYNDDLVTGTYVSAQALQKEGGRVFQWGAKTAGPDRESISGEFSKEEAIRKLPRGPRSFLPEASLDSMRLADMVEGPGRLDVPTMPEDMTIDATDFLMTDRHREVFGEPEDLF